MIAPRCGLAGIALDSRFGAPPFTVLDARQGYWRRRKEAWRALGLRDELGRAERFMQLAQHIRRRLGRRARRSSRPCDAAR